MSTAFRDERRAAMTLATAPALGPGVWHLDPAHSEATFRVRAMGGLIGIGGRFKVLDGAIQVDEAGVPTGRLRAHAGSLDTGIGIRDRHLRSADFFDAAQHPYLEFSVRELAKDRSGRMRITGDLVIRGVASPLEAEATVQNAGDGTIEITADAAVEHAAVGRALKRGRVIKGPARLTARLRFVRDGKAEMRTTALGTADIGPLSRPRWLDGSLYPFLSRYVEIDGHKIHYIDEGTGPTLLFLHAVPLWSFQYRKIIPGLTDRFRCVALDYPGFGLSTAAPGYHGTLAGTSQLVEQVIAALHLSEITLVGHDSSAAAGLGVAVRRPQWFTGLVISNSFAWPLEDAPSIYRFVKIVSSPAFRFMIINFNFLINYTVKQLANGKLSEAERTAYRGPFITREVRYHQYDMLKTLSRSREYLVDLQAKMRGLREMPALLIFSDNDSTYKAGWLDRYEEMFPRHRSVVIKGTGNSQADHFPQETAPAEMVAAIRNWWSTRR